MVQCNYADQGFSKRNKYERPCDIIVDRSKMRKFYINISAMQMYSLTILMKYFLKKNELSEFWAQLFINIYMIFFFHYSRHIPVYTRTGTARCNK